VGQEFERYLPVQPFVLGFINDTHPAVAQLLDDAVVRDGAAIDQNQYFWVMKRPRVQSSASATGRTESPGISPIDDGLATHGKQLGSIMFSPSHLLETVCSTPWNSMG
jgi:hypothetical protein